MINGKSELTKQVFFSPKSECHHVGPSSADFRVAILEPTRRVASSATKTVCSTFDFMNPFFFLVYVGSDDVPYSLKKRIPCREPGCDRNFSDPSTLSRHMKKRHQLRRGRPPPWIDFTSKFSIAGTETVEAKPPALCATRKSGSGVKTKRRALSHTSVETQEGLSCQSLSVDSSLLTIAASPTPSPLSGSNVSYQPDWQFPSSVSYNSSGSVMDISSSSCSTALLPELSFSENSLNNMMPGDFQFGFGMPNGTSSIQPAEQSVVLNQPYLMDIPAGEDFMARSSCYPLFSMANTVLPGPSYGPVTNYDDCFDLFRDSSKGQWQVDSRAPIFGYCGPTSENDARFCQFNGFSSF